MIGMNRMKFKMFHKTNKIFFITLCIVVVVNIISFIWISSGKAYSNPTYKTFSMWIDVLDFDFGGLLTGLMPIFIIIGSSNNLNEYIRTRFISNIHLRKPKIKHFFLETIKSGILGGLIASIPQLISYGLCLLFFSPHNDIRFIEYDTKNILISSGYYYVHYSLLLMFIYGFTIALFGIIMSLLIKRKSLYILVSYALYYSLFFYIRIVDNKFDLRNFYIPINLPQGTYTFSFFINILLVIICIFIGFISYLFIERYVEDDLYA